MGSDVRPHLRKVTLFEIVVIIEFDGGSFSMNREIVLSCYGAFEGRGRGISFCMCYKTRKKTDKTVL